jgi:ABC-type glycerol-3-phosphate transport system substrate-binding protein
MRTQFSRRRMLGITLVAVAAPLAAACGAPSAPTAAPTAAPAKSEVKPAADGKPGIDTPKPTVAAAAPAAGAKAAEVIFWPRSPSEAEVVWQKLIPIQQKMFPELTVKFEPPAEDFNGKLLIAYNGGTAPDGGVTGLSAFRAFIGRKMFKTIQPYVDSDKEIVDLLKEYVPAAITGYSYQKQLYATPTVNESILIFYNKDAMTEAGLTPPREIENDPAKWNWNTLVEYAKKLNKGTGFRRQRFGVVATGEKGISAMSESWGNMAYARGARFLDGDGEKWVFTGPEAKESIQYVVDLIHKHDVHPDVGESTAAKIRDRGFFQNNQVAMVVQGEYFRRYLWGSGKPTNGIPFAYDMAMMPFNPTTGKRTNVYHGNGSFMTSQTKNPDATWKWLKVVFSKDAQQVITNTWGSRGAHRGTYESWLKSNADGGPPGLNYEAIVKADTDTEAYPTTPYLTQAALMEPTARVLYDNVFINKMPVDQGLDQIAKETTALLEKGKKETGG